MKQRNSKTKRLLAILAMVAMISGLIPSVSGIQISYAAGGQEEGWMAPVSSNMNPTGTDYYVDATTGDDSASGTSIETAWKSLDRVNNTQFQPGDRILFKSDELWVGQLHPKGSGTPGNPIVIDQYGTGNKPKFEGRGEIAATVLLDNQAYWELYNLDVSNKAASNLNDANSLGDYRGIHITGNNGTQLNHFRLAGLNVHDVSGEVNWISGTVPENPQPGINFKTGWDRSKRTGGIIFDTSVVDPANPGNQATTFHDVVIENSIVQNTSFGNIIFKQYAGTSEDAVHVGWGERSSSADARFTPHTDIVIRNNYLSQYDTEYGCNSIYLTGVQGAKIEGNIVAGAGTSGIELYYTDDVVIQYNEVYETRRKAGGADHNGIDPDKATTKALIQYNYIHDTGDGILLCQFSFGDTIVRYNVIQNTERYPIYLHSDQRAVAEIYNNTIYNTKSKYMIYGYGSFVNATYNLYNNVFYSNRTDAVFTTGGNISYSNNSYYGADFPIPVEDTKAISLDPMIANLGQGGKGTLATGPNLASLTAYSPVSGSPLIGAGIEVASNGGLDVLGQTLYNDTADLGAVEYYGDLESDTESITGRVIDTYGNSVANAKVELIVGGQRYEASSNRTGYFALLNVPIGSDYILTGSKIGYHDTVLEDVAVIAGNTLSNVVIELEPATAFGGVSGILRDGLGAPLADADIVLSDSEDRSYRASSGSDGTYIINDVMTGQGYILTASKSGYRSATLEGVEVTPGYTTPLSDLFLTGSHPIYLLHQDFEQVDLESYPSDWTVSNSGGKISVVNDPGNDDNRSLEIIRSSNSGSTSFSKSFAADELTGIVTVETNIMRDDGVRSGNSWVSVPYIYGVGNSSPSISFAFDKGKIKAYNAGATVEIMEYEIGKWYNVQLVINLVTQKFDLYIDGELKLEQAAFRTPMTEIGKIEYYANSSNYVEAYLDDIRIIRGAPYAKNDTTLESFTIDSGEMKKLSEAHYTVELPNYIKSVELSAIAASQLVQSISIGGTVSIGYEAVSTIELEEGENIVEVVVTAEDGTVKTYRLVATVVESAKDTSLRSIQLSTGELEPVFSPEVLEYEVVNIEEETSSIHIMATANTSNATIEINGEEVPSGDFSTEILLTGAMELVIKVISQDGTAYREYVLSLDHIASEPEPVTVENLMLTPATVELKVGGTQTLTVTASYSDDTTENVTATASYATNDSEVATVSNIGVITAVAAGTATITVTFEDASAEVDVTVTETALPEEPVNKSALEAAIAAVGALNEEAYTEESWSAVADALSAAEELLADDEATQDDVDSAVEALNEAVANLVEKADEEAPTWSEGNQVTVSHVTTSSVTLEWGEATDNVGVTGYKVTWTVGSEDKEEEVDGDTRSLRITGLSSNTNYTFKVVAIDEAGNLSSELEVTATTARYIPPVDPQPEPEQPVDSEEPVDPEQPVDPEETVNPDPEPEQPQVEFTDVPATHWAAVAIKRAAALGIVQGHPDHTFKPAEPTTRAQFMTMLANAFKWQNEQAEQGELGFTDNDKIGGWAKDAIAQGIERGIITGYTDGSFRPNQEITRTEMIVMLARALGIAQSTSEQTQFTDDAAIPAWGKGAVEALRELGLVSGRSNNSFAPNDAATRAEAIVIILRTLDLNQ